MFVYDAFMKTSTVNIAFKEDLLKEIDKIAKKESRSRSELIRDAARIYLDNKEQWNRLFKFGSQTAAKQNMTKEDVIAEIKDHRQNR